MNEVNKMILEPIVGAQKNEHEKRNRGLICRTDGRDEQAHLDERCLSETD